MNYAMTFEGHGTFTPDGRVDMTAEQVHAHNAELEAAELAEWSKVPDRWQVYAWVGVGGSVTTFLGTPLGRVTEVSKYVNNFGATIESIRFRGTNGATYYGRYGADWSQLCRVRKAKG